MFLFWCILVAGLWITMHAIMSAFREQEKVKVWGKWVWWTGSKAIIISMFRILSGVIISGAAVGALSDVPNGTDKILSAGVILFGLSVVMKLAVVFLNLSDDGELGDEPLQRSIDQDQKPPI